jgi:NADH-quinone oxidoreductase subunit I
MIAMGVSERGYIGGLLYGLWTLMLGLKVTFIEFFTKKTTQHYPENRKSLVMFDRYRGNLIMVRDDTGINQCTACGLCEMNCPNQTIVVESETITDEETGKKDRKSVV